MSVQRWWYQDAQGRWVFQHYRFGDRSSAQDKRYGYRYPAKLVDNKVHGWIYGKPPGADALIYRLPLVLANPDARLLLTEGESDACAALGRRILASCHHGGARKFTEAMAESLAGHRGKIVLVADNDVPGAACVVGRYDLLRAVGIPAKRLRVCEVVPTHPGADLRDHLEAGYRLGDLRRADLDRLREVAKTPPDRLPASVKAQMHKDYPDLVYVSGLGWVNKHTDYLVFPDPSYAAFLEACKSTADEAAQLRHWRPEIVKRGAS